MSPTASISSTRKNRTRSGKSATTSRWLSTRARRKTRSSSGRRYWPDKRATPRPRQIIHTNSGPASAATGRVELLAAEHAAEELTPSCEPHQEIASSSEEIARQSQQTVGRAKEREGRQFDRRHRWVEHRSRGTETILADSTRLCQLAETSFGSPRTRPTPCRYVTATADGSPSGTTALRSTAGIEGPFELYYASTDEGVGLHLAVIREIAHGHGWEITLANESTGRVRLNVTDVERPSAKTT